MATQQRPKQSVWDHLAFWRPDSPAPQPMPQQAAMQPPMAQPSVNVEARQVPQENMQYAGSYPSLQSVPPRPPLDDTARMNGISQQMQQDHVNATAAAQRLDADAAREPMLSPLPSSGGVAPVPLPVSSAALPPPAGATVAPANSGPMVQQPAPMMPTPMNVAPPAPGQQSINYPMLPPPPPPLMSAGSMQAQPAPIAYASPQQPAPQVAYAQPQQAPAMEPIMLHPPGAAPQPLPPSGNGYQPAPLPQPAMPPAAPGSFDPMAGAAPAPANGTQQIAGGTGYLPDSRYASRREWQ